MKYNLGQIKNTVLVDMIYKLGRIKTNFIVVLACLSILFSGCVTYPTMKSCHQNIDPVARLSCMNQSMFGVVTNGAVIGIVGGAILGGAVTFAFNHNPASITKGAVTGAIVGGVAGGLTAYLSEVQERTAGRIEDMIAYDMADRKAATRKYEEYVQMSNENRKQYEQLQFDTVKRINQRIDLMTDEMKKQRESLSVISKELLLANKKYKEAYDIYNQAESRFGSTIDNKIQTITNTQRQQIIDVDNNNREVERIEEKLKSLIPGSRPETS